MDEDGLQSVSPRGLQPKPPKSSLLSCPLHLTVGGPCVGRGGGVGGPPTVASGWAPALDASCSQENTWGSWGRRDSLLFWKQIKKGLGNEAP